MATGTGSSGKGAAKRSWLRKKVGAGGDAMVPFVDAATEALGETPVVGVGVKLLKAYDVARNSLFAHKLDAFLKGSTRASEEQRAAYLERLESPAKRRDFVAAFLMLVDRAEDAVKPEYIGRLLAAHIQGSIPLNVTMRLCKMVDRSYSEDLNYLQTFQNGLQREGTPVAESLLAAGFLSNGGFDGGTASEDGGLVYVMNDFGELLVKHALE